MAHAAGVHETGSRARNDALYPLVIAGDERAKQEMIEGNMALVTLRVETFIKNCPAAAFLRDDLISEGLLALTTAVNRMEPVSEPNPTGYILVAVSNAIEELVDKELYMQMSSETARRKRAAGEKLPTQIPVGRGVFEMAYDETKVRELRDTIESCAETDIERTILKLREEGNSDYDIAAEIDLPRLSIFRMRREMHQRFLDKTGIKGQA
jgi:hypothetical protein